jgi:hypothetical protein
MNICGSGWPLPLTGWQRSSSGLQKTTFGM